MFYKVKKQENAIHLCVFLNLNFAKKQYDVYYHHINNLI
jgi:hypothetical protein